jgi:Tol biopolymer transport system component
MKEVKVMIRRILLLTIITISTTSFASNKFTSEALYSHPMIVGTPPSGLTWAPDGKKLAFLWNDAGNRFKDLYVTDLSGKITRLTDLKGMPRSERASDSRTEQEKIDEITLDSGLSSLIWSRDGRSIYFSFRGDLWKIDIKKGSVPVRLLQTAASESNFSLSEDGGWIAYTSEDNIFALSTSS